MKTKQIITTIVILIIGILIGRFVLGNTSSAKGDHHKNETMEEHWTCSMHPKIDMPEFGQCPICGMDLILKENTDNEVAINSFKMTKNAMALANIETVIVGDSKNSSVNGKVLQLSGKIMANDKASAIQTAHFGGRLEKMYFKSQGEFVKKGALVASIYSPDLVTAQNELIEAMSIKELQPELYKAVRNKLKLWKISETQIQKIENTKKVMTNFNIYANVSGYVDELFTQEGNHVKEGSPLFKVSNLGSVWAVFDVYEQDIKNLKTGQIITIKLNAYPDIEIKSKINFIDPNLNTNTRTVSVRATLSNSKKILKPGMFLSSEILLNNTTKTKSKVIEVPKTAVLWTGKRSVVYVKTHKTEPVFELRKIQLGNDLGLNYQVLSGLENGEEVVFNGAFTVDAAAQLQGKSSMMNVVETNNSNINQKKVKSLKRIDVNPKFKEQLNIVFQDYINLKDAFVLTNTKKINEQATQTLKNLKKVKLIPITIGTKKQEAHKIWIPAVKTITENLASLEIETNIEKQRNTFINLSKTMIHLANSFGVNKPIYVQHCPMTNDNKGANWLSSEKAIKNPYFGKKMLQCGSIKQVIE